MRAEPKTLCIVAALALAGCALKEMPTREEVASQAMLNLTPPPQWAATRGNAGPVADNWLVTLNDPWLNELVKEAIAYNADLRIAAARVDVAAAYLAAAKSPAWPQVNLVARGGGKMSGDSSGLQGVGLFAAWELDLWGRVRRNVESQQANAQASAADYENIQLSAQAELAQDYFLLRAADSQKQLLDASAEAFDKSLQLTRNRYAGGVASRADVAQAETQLRTTQAQAIDVTVQRAQLEHAIAILIGKAPSQFSLPPVGLTALPPPVPTGVPSTLLERRPDIAAAERRVAAANAQIGVTIAAYYPTVTLGASVGFESNELSKWLEFPSRFWSVGPSISETVFDGGLRQAQTAQARAIYDQNVAFYRQTVLTGFREVEDNIAALRILEQEAQVQAEAVKAAQESVVLTTNQYKAGIVSYLNVVIAQAAALNNERTAVDIQNRRLTASVLLIKALGGGWDASLLPDPNALLRTGDAGAAASDKRALAGAK